ncbi:hypothetical protein WJX72_008113 [[Myrmecia] bisecta]|uniref:Nucleotide-diphospho-sugar transferase domain-containing protein n=1 Tax=[Myrmecia] bisecta TaxID=41462 RepID=A0AAW1Q7P6_9CHLO
MRRADAAGLTRRKVVLAVLLGCSLGLLASVFNIARKTRAADVQHQTERVQAQLNWQLTQQENLLADEKRKREVADQERQLAEDDAVKLQGKLEEVKSQLSELERQRSLATTQADVIKQERDSIRRAAEQIREKATKIAAQRDAALQEVAAAQKQITQLQHSKKRFLAAPMDTDRHTVWKPSPMRDQKDPQLASVLRKVAVNNEVLVAISDKNYAGANGMLQTWIENVQKAGVSNAMVVALDAATKQAAEHLHIAAHQMHLQISAAQKNVGANHAVSGLKFRVLRSFLNLGYSVLLSDVDIVTLQDPFAHLHRDSDIEGMSDGWDNATAYGYNDVFDDASMGWARYAHSMRVFVINSGLFYIRPTQASMDLLDRIVHRLDVEAGWDQAIFNEVIFFPSRPGYNDVAVTRRIMDFMLFMNSKVLFTKVRKDRKFNAHRPVMIHVNYHPDKHARMKAIVRRFVAGDKHALDHFPDGSE